jgi:glycosyltransferase involved in cell wall biosynthesis
MAQTIAQACGLPLEQIKAIPNALEVESFVVDKQGETKNGPQKNKDQGTEEITILHVGRLERVKGIDILVQAIPLVLQQMPQVRFVFIGASRSKEKRTIWQQQLEALSKEQDRLDRIIFLGFMEQPALIQWYQQADIAVVPSLNYESFSYTCAQAMAAGLPVVASRIGGIPETVDDGRSGLLVKPGDVSDLSQALIKLARDANLRRQMGEAGQQKAQRYFAAPTVARQMHQVYQATIH